MGRAAEQAAAAAPPHYEFTFGQAFRAWTAGDTEALTRAADADLPGAVHLLAVMTLALGDRRALVRGYVEACRQAVGQG
ncbi:hypothetical protein [Streptomyces sp. NBC_01483]|uniref:hypothetical protein n=1 Tax=Streptomyces sp. NBC_01483 TaxID=2903883 RepID=UPI002E36B73C|nr:hypothetical protein [Streptomyces sp. NBC_01483]